jgi:16S rRNA (cytidine1402-2'-O)-methyltransferase
VKQNIPFSATTENQDAPSLEPMQPSAESHVAPDSVWLRLAEKVGAQSWPASALYVVATPIGNLGDLTLRASQTLARADVIAAEDTRATRVLLDAWGIRTPLISAHRHNEASAADAIVQRLAAGQRVALVSDAGSPAVSDPGARIVATVSKAGYQVIPLPGPSALIAALMSSGVTTEDHPEFVFAGFAPTKSMARLKWFKYWCAIPAALVFYEAPHRISASLRDLLAVCSPTRPTTLARELTKRFEQIVTLPLEQACEWVLADAHREQGEYVVVLHNEVPSSEVETQDVSASLYAWLDALLPLLSVRDVAKVAAQATGLSRDAVYARALARKSR